VLALEACEKPCFAVCETVGRKAELVGEDLGLCGEAVEEPLAHRMRESDFGSAEAGCQGRSTDDSSALLFEPSAQIGKRRTISDNIIDDQDLTTRFDLAHEDRLTQNPGLRIGQCVRNDISLEYSRFEASGKVLGKHRCVDQRKGVRAFPVELHDGDNGIEGEWDLLGFENFLDYVISGLPYSALRPRCSQAGNEDESRLSG